MKKQDGEFHPSIGLRDWKDNEKRVFIFLNDGVDLTNENGLQWIYTVEFEGEKRNLWVKPNGPLAIGLQNILNNVTQDTLKGLKIAVTKTLGQRQKDTRYNCELMKK